MRYRRLLLLSLFGGLAGLARWPAVAAGVEEPLSDAMRLLLRQRLSAAAPALAVSPERQEQQARTMAALARWVPEPVLRSELTTHLWYEAQRAGLSVSWMLGLIEVESGFRKHAISYAGAMGYAQVMPFWTRLIGDGDVSALLRTQPNLRYACLILRHYLDQERGDLTLALGRYNGTRGGGAYPERVLQAAARWRAIHEAG